MSITNIIILILTLAPSYGVDPKVALAVAEVESGYNANATGGAGEIGLFQIMPAIAHKRGYTRKQLLNPATNIRLGLTMIKEAQRDCVHKEGITYLVCYNYGIANAKRVKHPTKFPYVRKVKAKMRRFSYEEYI